MTAWARVSKTHPPRFPAYPQLLPQLLTLEPSSFPSSLAPRSPSIPPLRLWFLILQTTALALTLTVSQPVRVCGLTHLTASVGAPPLYMV